MSEKNISNHKTDPHLHLCLTFSLLHVLTCNVIFPRGMQFKWILENSPGYAGYTVAGMERDQAAPLDDMWINKNGSEKVC